MTGLKVFALLNGGFFVLYGLWGAFLPARIARFMGFSVGQLGMHQIRAVWMGMAMMGLIMCAATLKMRDLRPVVLAIMLIMLGFLTGRLLGLVFDGAGPVQTYYEMGIELAVIALGAFLLSRVSSAG